MRKYDVKTPREQYQVESKDKDDARKEVIERENITIERASDVEKLFEIKDLRKELPFQRSLGINPKSRINKVIIHHDGQWRPDSYDSFKRYYAQAKYHIGKGYGHISYHFKIDNVGTIFQNLDLDERAYHAGSWWTNLTSIAICFDGNMDIQSLTEAQIASYKKLMRHLTTQRPDLPKVLQGSEKGHKEIKSTACPGKHTMPIIHEY